MEFTTDDIDNSDMWNLSDSFVNDTSKDMYICITSTWFQTGAMILIYPHLRRTKKVMITYSIDKQHKPTTPGPKQHEITLSIF